VTVQPTPIYETVTMCLVTYLLWQLRDRVRPGVVFASYLVLSGLERFLVEFIRRNNEVLAGLTSPQLESIALLATGLVWLALLARGSGLRGGRTGASTSRPTIA
jgi:phosphatidylglycerol:prolipoprotein diacylglycerol transferase